MAEPHPEREIGEGEERAEVKAAIDAVPRDNAQRVVIFLRAGTYREHVRLDRSFVTLLGEDRPTTRIVWEINDRRLDPEAHADGRRQSTDL